MKMAIKLAAVAAGGACVAGCMMMSTAFSAEKNRIVGNVEADFVGITAPVWHYAVPPMSELQRLPDAYPTDVTATRTPGTWLAARVAEDGRSLLVMVNNLAGEPRGDIKLEFAKKWLGATVLSLQKDGSWKACGSASASFVPADGHIYEPMVPEFFRIERIK